MKQDNGNHAATPGAALAHEKAVAELACRELTDERDRLKAINAELVEALEECVVWIEAGLELTPSIKGMRILGKVLKMRDKARAVLDKARKED